MERSMKVPTADEVLGRPRIEVYLPNGEMHVIDPRRVAEDYRKSLEELEEIRLPFTGFVAKLVK